MDDIQRIDDRETWICLGSMASYGCMPDELEFKTEVEGWLLVLNGLFHCVHVLSVFYLCEYRLLKCETGVGLTFLMRSL